MFRFSGVLLLVWVFVFGIFSINPKAFAEDAGRVEVSIIQIIANPDQFDGKRVRTSGFLHVEMEGTALYIDESSYRGRIYKNSLALRGGRFGVLGGLRAPYNRSVYIEGVVDSHGKGHGGLHAGAIDEVNVVVPAATARDEFFARVNVYLGYWKWIIIAVATALVSGLLLLRMRSSHG